MILRFFGERVEENMDFGFNKNVIYGVILRFFGGGLKKTWILDPRRGSFILYFSGF